MTPDGMVVVSSPYSPEETLQRLTRAVTRRGNKIFTEIDHADAAARVGLTLRPTTVLVFGNPAVGTRLMREAQTLGLDLPLKALVWEDAQGKTWLGYDVPAWLTRRHNADLDKHPITQGMTAALAEIAEEVVGKSAG